MTIGGIGGNGGTGAGTSAVGMGTGGMDAYGKSLQKQIMDAQKQLQELSGNDEMSAEMKMKKRQELQKQISDLNMQLRQHQMEERRKAQEEKQERQAKSQPQKANGEQEGGLSKGSMQAMISAEGSLKLAKQQGKTAKEMQNGADIKRMEIKLDGGGSKRTADDSAAISSKWDDVEGMEQKAKGATASQMSLLAKAQEEADKAGGESGAGTKTGRTDKTDKTDEKDNTKTQEQDGISDREGQNDGITAETQTAPIGSNVDVRI